MRDRRRIVIAGAAGRDFHNFNTVYRDDPGCEVVAFTAAQIPGIAGRRYPAALAGARYPDGIAIVPEAELDALVRSRGVDEVVLAYSDLAHVEAMHLAIGNVVYAGIDYERVIALAAREADLLLWDGGNNDFPFVRPDLHVVLADALRPGDASTHHPGEACARMADVIVLSKCDSAPAADVAALGAACRALNPEAPIVRAALPISLERPA